MCTFHYIRQTGSLFERERDRTGCVRFTANKVVCASKLKTQKFRSFNIEELGKFREVVLTRWVPRNAIRARFEEGWS